jgi:DNA-binding transcriptional LysR family regulator
MLEELRTLVLFAEEGSIQRVAQRLPLTQPAVSRQIQRLEEALGIPLLDRRQKPPSLTPAGLEVLTRGREIIEAVEDLKALRGDRKPEGVFRLGLVNGLAHARIAEAVVAIAAQFPRVLVRLKSGWSAELAEQHRLGLLDAAIILSDNSRFYGAERIGEEQLVIIGARSLAKKRKAQSEPGWVLSPDPCDARQSLARQLARENRALIVAAEVEHAGLQMGLVQKGIGLGLMPKRLFDQEPPPGTVEIKALRDELRLDALMLRSPHLGALQQVANAIADEIRQFMAGGERPA